MKKACLVAVVFLATATAGEHDLGTQPPCLHIRQSGRRGGDHGVCLSPDRIGERRTHALVVDNGYFDPGHIGEEFRGKVRVGALAARCEVDLSRL